MQHFRLGQDGLRFPKAPFRHGEGKPEGKIWCNCLKQLINLLKKPSLWRYLSLLKVSVHSWALFWFVSLLFSPVLKLKCSNPAVDLGGGTTTLDTHSTPKQGAALQHSFLGNNIAKTQQQKEQFRPCWDNPSFLLLLQAWVYICAFPFLMIYISHKPGLAWPSKTWANTGVGLSLIHLAAITSSELWQAVPISAQLKLCYVSHNPGNKRQSELHQ